jgi:hypothetical protein
MRTLSEILQSNLLNILPPELILTWHQQYRFTFAEMLSYSIGSDIVLGHLVIDGNAMLTQFQTSVNPIKVGEQLNLSFFACFCQIPHLILGHAASCIFLNHQSCFLFYSLNLNFSNPLSCSHCSL